MSDDGGDLTKWNIYLQHCLWFTFDTYIAPHIVLDWKDTPAFVNDN